MKAQAAGQRSASVVRHPRTAATSWRKRRRESAREVGVVLPRSAGASTGVELTVQPHEDGPAASVMAWVAARAAALALALRRLEAMATPVEPVPSSWAGSPLVSPEASAADAPVDDGPGLAAVAPPEREAIPWSPPPPSASPLEERLEQPAAQAAAKPPVIDPGQAPGVERARSTMAQRIGDDAERVAALRLEAMGWKILARNLRVRRAEVDLLAIDPSDPPTLVVVEVRRRSRRDFGLAEETVDHRKRAMLWRAAGELAARRALPDGRRLPPLPVRVDLIAIDRGPDGRPSLRHHQGIEA